MANLSSTIPTSRENNAPAPRNGGTKPRNVIILTSGISGSSVLTGLISRAGYWTGDATYKKEYDTYENAELIKLNQHLFQTSGYTGKYTMDFSADAIAKIAALRGTADEGPFREFLALCEQHGPWVWKDPRLWLTIRFWKDMLPLSECKFIVLTRDLVHCWVSSILRRHIRSYGSMKRYEVSIKNSILGFLSDNQLPYLNMTYENLVVNPEQEIGRLNAHLGTNLTVNDLAAIYHKPLYKAPRSSSIDYAKAGLIYVKNYSKRYDLVEENKK